MWGVGEYVYMGYMCSMFVVSVVYLWYEYVVCVVHTCAGGSAVEAGKSVWCMYVSVGVCM